jgi:hypothetical protein
LAAGLVNPAFSMQSQYTFFRSGVNIPFEVSMSLVQRPD